jgi:hypothetical protein
VQLFGAFHIDLADLQCEREPKLVFGLADARKHNLRGRHACEASATKFTFTDHISAGAFGDKHADYGKMVVGFERIVQGDLETGIRECPGKGAVPLAHGSGAIDPHRRANGIGDGVQWDRLQHEPVKRMHRQMRARGQQFSDVRISRVSAWGTQCHPPTLP